MHHHHQSQKHYVIIIIISSSSSITRGASYLWLDHYYCLSFFVYSLSLSLSCFLFVKIVVVVVVVVVVVIEQKRRKIVGQKREEKNLAGQNSFTTNHKKLLVLTD